MTQTPSTMLPLGTQLPDFSLLDAVSGQTVTSALAAGAPATLVMFVCNHCPYVVHIRDGIEALARDYTARGVAIVAINSNSVRTHPQDGPAAMKRLAEERQWGFPFLFDETQTVAKTFRAACTPDFFLFDGRQMLAYRGQLDDSRPGNGHPVTGRDLRAALDAVLAGQKLLAEQTPSVGCNIKWGPGNAPDYAG